MYRKFILAAVLALCAVQTASAQTAPGPSPVVLVMIIELGATATATAPKLVELMKRAGELAKKEGESAGKAHLYAPTLGEAPNQMAIVVEFPSLAAFAASETAHAQSAEWQKITADAIAAGLKLVSRTLSTEVKY